MLHVKLKIDLDHLDYDFFDLLEIFLFLCCILYLVVDYIVKSLYVLHVYVDSSFGYILSEICHYMVVVLRINMWTTVG